MFKWLFLQGTAPSCTQGCPGFFSTSGFPQGIPVTSPFKGFFYPWAVCCVFPGGRMALREAILFLLQPSRAGSASFAWPGWLLPRAKELGRL